MFLRLRDTADLLFCDPGQGYLDTRNYNVHWEWEFYYDKLPVSVTENLIKIPRIYSDNQYKIVCTFAEKEKNNHPELYEIYLNTNEQHRVYEILEYVDIHKIYDVYAEFAIKSVMRILREWCKDNNIPCGM